MIWLYRLQQRLSLTRQEGVAILTLASLFFVGLGVQHVQQQQVPPIAADSLTVSPVVQTGGASSQTTDRPSRDDPLHLNHASAKALEALPGIGPTLADRIVGYRETQRPFQRVTELRRVRGIGGKTVEDLRPLVTVSSTQAK